MKKINTGSEVLSFSNWLAMTFLALHWFARFNGWEDAAFVFLCANVVCIGFSIGWYLKSRKGGE